MLHTPTLRPCPTASEFSIPCPGCSGGARAEIEVAVRTEEVTRAA